MTATSSGLVCKTIASSLEVFLRSATLYRKMTFAFCCCCRPFDLENSLERQPLLRPSAVRQELPVAGGTANTSSRLSPKRVGVPGIDQCFADIADTFNRQQEHYESMTECLKSLRDSYCCSHGDSLSDCVRKMKDEHSAISFSLQMKGYDFALVLSPGPVPEQLQKTQEQVKVLCLCAKAITGTGTSLHEMISWALQSEKDFAQQVRKAAPTFLDQQRLGANLKEDLLEVQRARDLSIKYRQDAGDLLNEVAQLTLVKPGL